MALYISVRFWDEKSQRYAVSRSLGITVEGKRERRREAEEKARLLVPAVQEEFKVLHTPVPGGGEKPASGADLPKTKFSRKPALIITHTEADKAKTAWYSTCYENSKGETGPWSPIEEAVIG